jgi:hypothetical protein
VALVSKKALTPPVNLISNAIWIGLVLAAFRFLLGRFGGSVGSQLSARL